MNLGTFQKYCGSNFYYFEIFFSVRKLLMTQEVKEEAGLNRIDPPSEMFIMASFVLPGLFRENSGKFSPRSH